MRTEKKIPQKKAHQLPISSMSSNFSSRGAMKKSGKHRSQEMQAMNKKSRQKANRKYQRENRLK